MHGQQTKQNVSHENVTDPFNLPSADLFDPVIEAYKKDVDRTLLRENLKLSAAQRCRKFQRNMALMSELRRAGRTLDAEAKR